MNLKILLYFGSEAALKTCLYAQYTVYIRMYVMTSVLKEGT